MRPFSPVAEAIAAGAALEGDGDLAVVAHRPWPGSAITVAPGGEWIAVALPGRVVVARLPHLDDVREIHVADVRSLAAITDDRLVLAPHRGLLVIEDPLGTPHVGVRARGAGRVVVSAGPSGLLVAVGERAALPRATVVARTDLGRRRGWTASIPGATAAAWLGERDLVVAAGADLVLVRDGEVDARAEGPLGEPITALVSVPGGVVVAGAGPRAVVHATMPGAPRPAIDVAPGGARWLHAAEGLLAVGTRSLGERVAVHDLEEGGVVGTLRGVAAAVLAPPLLAATGREGTVVLAG